MKSNIFVILLLLVSVRAFSQTGAVPPVIRAQNTLDDMARGGVGTSTLLYGLPMPAGKVIGDFYLDKKWNVTTILLYPDDKLLEGYLTRLDIKNQVLEIRVAKETKVMGVEKIRSVVWIDSLTTLPRYFINARDYKIDGTRLTGLIEVVEDGKLPLFKYTSAYVKRADYNVAFDVGSKDDKIMKDEAFYFAVNGDLIEFKNKKSIDAAFGEKNQIMDTFIKQQKLSLSKEKDLITIFRHYNTFTF